MLNVVGTGIGFGKVAEYDNIADFAFKPRFRQNPEYVVNGRIRTPFYMYSANDDYGDGIVIGAGGVVIIGSGESAETFKAGAGLSNNAGLEYTYITSDHNVIIYTNLQDNYNNRHEFIFNNYGEIYVGRTDWPSANTYPNAHVWVRNNLVTGGLAANGTGPFGLFSATHSKWVIVDDQNNSVSINGYIFRVFYNGDAAITKSFKIPKNGAQSYGICNSDGISIIRDHNNKNVTVDATGGALFLGYQNTNQINILCNKSWFDADGDLNVNIVVPKTNNTGALGIASRRWNNAHIRTINLYSNINGTSVNGNNPSVISTGANEVNFGTSGSQSGVLTRLRGNVVRIYAHGSSAVYLGSGGSTAITSDENVKNIFEIDNKYINFFNNLKPISYMYKHNGHRMHMGFGARQVEESLLKAGLTTKDFAGVLIDKDVTISADEAETEEDVHYDELYSLRYEEFISLNTAMIQKCLKEIDQLKEIIKNLKGE